MPALYVFDRKTCFGGDDLIVSMVSAIVFRVAQVFCLVLLFFHLMEAMDGMELVQTIDAGNNRTHTAATTIEQQREQDVIRDDGEDRLGDDGCIKSHENSTYLSLLWFYAAASSLYVVASGTNEALIGYWSLQGTPTTNVEPRSSRLKQLLELKLIPFGLALFTFSTLGAFMSILGHRRGRACVYQDFDPSEEADDIPEWYDALAESSNVVRTVTYALFLSQLVEVFIYIWYLRRWGNRPRRKRRINVQDRSVQVEHDGLPEDGSTLGGGDGDDDIVVQDSDLRRAMAEENWTRRCSCLFACMGISTCFLFGGQELVVVPKPGRRRQTNSRAAAADHFGGVASALVDLFDMDILELVASDITAAFWILRRKHLLAIESLHRQASQQQASIHNNNDNNNNNEAARRNAIVDSNNSLDGSFHSALECLSDIVVTTTTPFPEQEGGSAEFRRRRQQQQNLCRAVLYRRNLVTEAYEQLYRVLLEPSNVLDMKALEEGARYMPFATAMYTWIMYLYMRPITGVPLLATKVIGLYCQKAIHCTTACGKKSRKTNNKIDEKEIIEEEKHQEKAGGTSSLSCCFRRNIQPNKNGRIHGDNICLAHRSALLLMAGIQDADLVYLLLKSDFEHTPYSIILDHKFQTIVLAIRGTFSLEDSITDLLVEPMALDQVGAECGFDGKDQFCHRGVLQAAQNVYGDLQEHKLLDQLLVGQNAKYPSYNLRLVGHSLGAGVSVMLSYMLRPKFPRLQCTSFAPPGCTLSWKLAIDCREWCISYVCGMDVVPRISIDSVEDLRDVMLDMIGRIKVPKMEVYRRLMDSKTSLSCLLTTSTCCMVKSSLNSDSDTVLKDILFEPDQVPETEYRSRFEQFQRMQEQQRSIRGQLRAVKLFPPGKLIHFCRTEEQSIPLLNQNSMRRGGDSPLAYVPTWIENDDLNEILISPRMVGDHAPDSMQNVMDLTVRKYRRWQQQEAQSE